MLGRQRNPYESSDE
jgi:26S proteasome regulatory subunit N1